MVPTLCADSARVRDWLPVRQARCTAVVVLDPAGHRVRCGQPNPFIDDMRGSQVGLSPDRRAPRSGEVPGAGAWA
jgi:hypothetical protein